MKDSVSNRLQYMLREKRLRQADLLEMVLPYCQKYDVKIPRNGLSQYITGKVIPKQDKIAVLAMALNVSEAWLMGFDVPMERDEKNAPAVSRDETDEFVRLFSSLSPENRQMMLGLMRQLAEVQARNVDHQP